MAAAETPRSGPAWDFAHGPLQVASDGRHLVHADGTPFFYLGDTAWELLHRLDRAELELYLENRRQKGFTVIQAVALAELDGLHAPNAHGDLPLVDDDPARLAVTDGDDPQDAAAYDYWDHVDYAIERAAAKGLYIGLLPTWGDKVTLAWGKGPVVFDEHKARAYGELLGARYKNSPNVIWILGGDRNPDGREALWRAMAAGLQAGDGGAHLLTYHPQGGSSSATWFHGDGWLAFNMLQSGHGAFDIPNYQAISADYARTPAKPCIDGEPRYEDHPVNWDPGRGWFDDWDVRQAAYWALFAGAHGHTYGCHDIWQFFSTAHPPISAARTPWQQALDLPGAWDMLHVRNLMLSRPVLGRVPDQALIAGGQAEGREHVRATRGPGYALLYLPTGKNVRVALDALGATAIKAWWFDPRQGKSTAIGELPGSGVHELDPPGDAARGNDWVLVLDDVARGFAPPGEVAAPPAADGPATAHDAQVSGDGGATADAGLAPGDAGAGGADGPRRAMGGCGCEAAGGPGSATLLALSALLLLRRPRRAQDVAARPR